VTPVVRLVVVGCALVALSGCGRSSATGSIGPAPAGGSAYTLMQMNLCLSGLADCYTNKVAYPAALDEAVSLIRQTQPDAVTVSEGCSGDIARIARQTGYHPRFSTVIYGGKPFRCIDPGGRGVFGDAVLTRAAITRADNHAFRAQTDIERRRWLCVKTRDGVEVCTAHLSTRSPEEVVGNDGQCTALATILGHRPPARAVIFGGDVNRRGSCAPDGFWTRTDARAGQSPGLQQVYGSRALRSPRAVVVPFAHSDHDVLVVRARFAR
jgi:endonuclease/exonuclease/phosphatase (EEP) superfamily protein YafD